MRWRAVPRVPGGKGPQRRFATEREARAYLVDVEGQVAQGTYVDAQWARGVLLADWVREWEATRSVLKLSTRATDRSRLPHVLAAFGNMTLDNITPMLVQQWVSGLSETLAPKTVSHCHVLLHSILDLAVKDGRLRRNPCSRIVLPELPPREHVYLTEDEAARLIDAHPLLWRPLPTLLVGTGLRWAEAVGLRVKRVDVARGELTVAETWSPRFGWGTPKTMASRRTIGLSAVVLGAVEPLLFGKGPDAPVFRTPRGNMVRGENYRRRAWDAAVKAAGLEDKHPTPHGLRHTHAAWLISRGVPLPAIQRRLGHHSIEITADVYGGLLPRVDEMLLAAVDAAMGAGVPDVVPDGLLSPKDPRIGDG